MILSVYTMKQPTLIVKKAMLKYSNCQIVDLQAFIMKCESLHYLSNYTAVYDIV